MKAKPVGFSCKKGSSATFMRNLSKLVLLSALGLTTAPWVPGNAAASAPAALCRGANQNSTSTPAASGDGRQLDRRAYRLHGLTRSLIAARLDACWQEEHEISGERDRKGRSGDMAAVLQMDRQLLAVRKEIDQLRIELSRENRFLLGGDEADQTKRPLLEKEP